MELTISFTINNHTVSFEDTMWHEIDLNQLWADMPTDEYGVATVTMKEALRAEIWKAHMLTFSDDEAQREASRANLYDDLLVSDIVIKDYKSMSDEPHMDFMLCHVGDWSACLDMIKLYEWIDPQSRQDWTQRMGVFAWLSDESSNYRCFDFDMIDRWVSDNFKGSWEDVEDYARMIETEFDLYIPAGYSLTDEDEFMAEHGVQAIACGDELMFFSTDA